MLTRLAEEEGDDDGDDVGSGDGNGTGLKRSPRLNSRRDGNGRQRGGPSQGVLVNAVCTV